MKGETNATVDRALALLEHFSSSAELGITEMAKLTGSDKASVSRQVRSLEKGGYLTQNPETRKYRLGLKFLYWGMLVDSRNELARAGLPIMRELCTRYRLASQMCILEKGYSRVIQQVVDGPLMSRMVRKGAALPAYAMASGKVLLACAGDDYIRSYLDAVTFQAYTPHTITDRDALVRELAAIREQGYSEDNEESCEGLSCLAVPVFGYTGQAAASLSLSGQTRFVQEHHEEIIRDLRGAAARFCPQAP